MPKLTYEQKRLRIRQLEQEIAEKESELRELIDPPEKTVQLPADFSVNEKVWEVMQEKPERIEKQAIASRIKERYGVSLTQEQITSAVSSLKYKKKIEIIGRAVYKVIGDIKEAN